MMSHKFQFNFYSEREAEFSPTISFFDTAFWVQNETNKQKKDKEKVTPLWFQILLPGELWLTGY